MHIPQVSVLMTVYNREQFLRDAVSSVLGSGFTDFELIIVDDCSKDASAKLAAELAATDSRIRFVQNEKNLGDYGNRAKAAALARGRFLKYVDSDDMIYPHTLEVMYRSVTGCSNVGLALSHSQSEAERPYPLCLSSEAAWRRQFLGRGCLACGPTGAIICRSAFESVGGFRAEWGVLSDIDLWLRLAAIRPVVLMPPGLVWWRRHEGQEYSSDGAEFVYLTRGMALTRAALRGSDNPLSPADTREALGRAEQHHARRLLALLFRKQRPRLFWQAFRQSGLNLGTLLQGLKPYRRPVIGDSGRAE
jgi:glycosyltransferase involved in cell wall biosynthesis